MENESDACDAVRDTTLGLPLDVDYDALKTKALNGGVDWVPPGFVYLDGTLLFVFVSAPTCTLLDVSVPRPAAQFSVFPTVCGSQNVLSQHMLCELE